MAFTIRYARRKRRQLRLFFLNKIYKASTVNLSEIRSLFGRRSLNFIKYLVHFFHPLFAYLT